MPKKAVPSFGSPESQVPQRDSFGFYSGFRPESFPGFYINTCQRHVWMSSVEASSSRSFTGLMDGEASSVEVYRGYEAYLFLLRFATGLESEVQGETDIFGQIKDAWRKEKGQNRPLSQNLESWMQKLFEDTKEIRSRFLQNVGGSSYGTLVRRIIKSRSKIDSEGPVLLIGAGNIAQSIAPLLLEHDLWLWNRTPEKLSFLFSELAGRSKSQIQQFSRSAEKRVWNTARHVVVCIPLVPGEDEQRIAWFREGGSLAERAVIHLGGGRTECGAWNSLPLFHSLDDLFELEKSAGNVRSIQISKAIKACEERAKLRSLGESLSIHHGWEDLASFL